MSQDFYIALNKVKRVLAVDFACEENNFENQGVFIYQSKELPGRRRFPFREKAFTVASMGRGVVVSCNLERLGWADANLSQLSRNDIFSPPVITMMKEFIDKDGQTIIGPDLKYICSTSLFRPYSPGDDIKIKLVEDPEQLKKYNDDERFLNAKGYSNNPRRVAAFATLKGKIAGIATACADCDALWQIGVDTLPEYRNRGIAKGTVSALTAYILGKNIVPYYSTLETNLESRAVVDVLGFKTAWLELYAREVKA